VNIRSRRVVIVDEKKKIFKKGLPTLTLSSPPSQLLPLPLCFTARCLICVVRKERLKERKSGTSPPSKPHRQVMYLDYSWHLNLTASQRAKHRLHFFFFLLKSKGESAHVSYLREKMTFVRRRSFACVRACMPGQVYRCLSVPNAGMTFRSLAHLHCCIQASIFSVGSKLSKGPLFAFAFQEIVFFRNCFDTLVLFHILQRTFLLKKHWRGSLVISM
jgi:hypothetical protein